MALVRLVWLALLLGIFSLLSITESQEIIQVFSNCSQNGQNVCKDLDQALESSRYLSNTVIKLSSGTHVIHSHHEQALWDIQDVLLEGEKSGAVFVNCDGNYSLAILNATNLQIANITFDGCGLTGPYLNRITERLKQTMELDFVIPDVIKVGILIGLCKNFIMRNVVIANTSGIGLIGINILGQSKIINSNFTANIRPKCDPYEQLPLSLFNHDPSIFYQIGGGLFLLFQDTFENTSSTIANLNTSLLVSDCHFVKNAECGYSGYTNINYQYFNSMRRLQYLVGGGGGMATFMAQRLFSVSMNVESSVFSGNEARYGSGIHIGLYADSYTTDVTFLGCSFDGNGGPRSIGGAGIAVFLNLLRESDLNRHQQNRCLLCKNITIVNSNFTSNRVLGQGGAVLAYSLSSTTRSNYNLEHYDNVMTLRNCLLARNVANYGSAVYASQRSSHGLDGLFGLKFEDVMIENNAIFVKDSGFIRNTSTNYVAAFDLRSVNLVITKGNLTIKDSESSGMYVWSSLILMMEDTSINFENNKANRGGGLFMEGYTPVIVLSGNCTMVFRNNVASTEGGGIFFMDSFNLLDNLHPLNSDQCFLFGSNVYLGDEFGSDILRSNNKIYFTSNQAPLGSIIYGSSLSSCPWARNFTSKSALLELHQKYSSTFMFDKTPEGTERVSSGPVSLVLVNEIKNFESYPGQVLNIDVEARDMFGEEIEAVLTSDIYDYDEEGKAMLSSSGFTYKMLNQSLLLQIQGIYNENVTVNLYTDNNLVSTSLDVSVTKCPIGFAYRSGKCECNVTGVEGLRCDEDNVTIIVIGETWVGCLSKECVYSSDLVVVNCKFSYCEPSNVVYDPSDTSNQCRGDLNRDRIMCGGCKDGYSISFGSQCNKCNEISISYVTIYILLHSFFFFFLMTVVRVTIDREWTNMIFFFSSIVFPYLFIENFHPRVLPRVLYLMRLVSQDRFGRICFYYGLSALDRTTMVLLYPVYLFILMLIFALLCRYSSFMSRHFSPAKTLMTLAYFCYVSTFKVCIEILAFKVFQNIGKTFVQVRWSIDPNVLFFQSVQHAFLGIVSIGVFLLYLVPGLVLLLFPSQVYKRVKGFHPFLDIIWAPFKTKYRPWAAVRLLFSVIIIMVAQYFPTVESSIITSIFFIAIFLYIQMVIQPFKDRLANIIDNFFVLIVLFMHIMGVLIQLYRSDRELKYIFVLLGVLLLVLSYIIFGATFIVYSRESIKWMYQKMRNGFKRCHKRRDLSFVVIETVQHTTHSSISCHSHSTHPIVDYSRYRESILDDEESTPLNFPDNHAPLDPVDPLEPI